MAQDSAAQAGQAAANAAPAAEQVVQRTDTTPGTFWMPQAASTATDSVDWLFYGILGLSVFCFVAITITVVYFTIKYRRRPGHKREKSQHHSDALEITWTVIPSIICVFIFIWGWQGFVDLQTAPKHALEIRVTGQKWNWQFQYPNGWVDDKLHAPVNEPVRLTMRSEDVIHSLFIPAFRQKQDVLPARYTQVWFEATKPGVYRISCAEYCGQQHSGMKTELIVHETGGYEKFLVEAEEKLLDMPPAELGKYLYEKRGCPQCHTIDGKAGTGPTFKVIFGEDRTFTDGTSGVVDDNYIRESLLEPQAKIRTGYNPVMPTFKGKLKDKHIDGIIAYIQSLK
jgi:cytochrome c oxidase subunit 2